jgi:hypothetical protein
MSCVLAALQTDKLGVTKIGNEAKPLKYTEKVRFCTDLEQIKVYGHRHRYTANDSAETNVCPPKCQFVA